MKQLKRSIAVMLMALGFASVAMAAETQDGAVKHHHAKKKEAQEAKPQVVTEQDVLATIKRRYPATVVSSIHPSGIDGIYEVMMGPNVAYVDAKVDYFLFGHLFDMQHQKDITQDRLDEANKIDFQKLPLDKAIKVVKGNGSRVFAVFTDPDCPYCKQLEKNLDTLNNYTMYVFLFPIPQLHPMAEDHANGVWCAKDRAASWTQSMASESYPTAPKDCTTPVKEIQAMGSSMGVQGTPTLFRADGKRLGGALPTDALDKWLDSK